MRRRGQRIWSYEYKVYIPCPGATKCDFARVSRENRMTQAELGLVIIQRAMNEPEWLLQTIGDYRSSGGSKS